MSEESDSSEFRSNTFEPQELKICGGAAACGSPLSDKVDRMQTLPDDVLRAILEVAAGHGTSSASSLRACSKYWTRVSDNSRTSVACEADIVAEVLPYMKRLPILRNITLTGSRTHSSIIHGTSLSTLTASLEVVRLGSGRPRHHFGLTDHNDPTMTMTIENIGSFLLPWSQTLHTLHLQNCRLPSSEDMTFGAPGFLCQFSLLSSLSLVDIQAMPALTSLDLRGCSRLLAISCTQCSFQSLDVSSCRALTSLICFDNSLSSLDLSSCPDLKMLDCEYNSLSTLDLSMLASLGELFCSHNPLTAVILPAAAEIDTIECVSVGKDLLMSGGAAVSDLVCDACTFKNMPFAMLSSLHALHMEDGSITGSVGGFKKLRVFTCAIDEHASLDFTGCTNVGVDCFCFGDELTILGREAVFTLALIGTVSLDDLHGFTNLQVLSYGITTPECLDLSMCGMLRKVSIGHEKDKNDKTVLAFVVLTGCVLLEELKVDGFESLLELDVAPCVKLKSLSCCGSGLSSLDVSCCTLLETLHISGSHVLKQLNTAGCNTLRDIKRIDCPILFMH